jgi:GST-like protein
VSDQNFPAGYVPAEVWQPNPENGGRFANINRPVAGATHEKALPVGEHPFQLYSLGTPNGVKVTIMFEELLAKGFSDAEYDAWLINIGEGDQFSSGFVAVNPNSKIPALVDRSTTPETRIFESGAMLVYLAEKFGAFLPTEASARAEVMSWLFWQMASAPYLGGGFGHFYAYARSEPGDAGVPRGGGLHHCRHRHLPLVRGVGEGPTLRRGDLPRGGKLQKRPALGAANQRPDAGKAR